MGKRRNIPDVPRLLSALLLLLALAWLTVSLPFVNKAQQHQHQLCSHNGSQTNDDNPLTNTTEEKNESGVSLLSEYLHETAEMEHNFITRPVFFKCHPSDLYLAYHPELLLPPPEA